MKMVLFSLAAMWAGTLALAQQTPNLGDLGAMVKPAEVPEPALPESFPLAQVAEQAQATETEIQALQSDAEATRVTDTVAKDLPKMTVEATARGTETKGILDSSPSLDSLQSQEAVWRQTQKMIAIWTTDLATRADALEKRDLRLARYEQIWTKTQEDAKKSGAMPEILQRIKAVITGIQKARAANQKTSGELVVLQTRVTAEDTRAREILSSIEQAQSRAIRMLLRPDAPVIWNPQALQNAGDGLKLANGESLSAQWTAVGAYLDRQRGSLVIHGVLIAALFGLLSWMRRHVGQWVTSDESLSSAAVIFEMPKATALVLSVLFSGWVYPQPPRLFWAILGGVALIPTIFVLHRLVAGALRQLLYALIAFYLYGLILSVSASLPVLSRFLLLAEMLGGAAFCFWFLRRARPPEDSSTPRLWLVARLGVRIALIVMTVAFFMNVLGFVGLSHFLNTGLLRSAYLALILNAALSVADALVGSLLHIRPFTRLRVVQRHRPLLRRRISRGLRWLAVIWWGLSTLSQLSLKRAFLEGLEEVLTRPWALGSATLSLGGVLTFFVVIAAAFLLSRFIRFVLEEDIFPRVRLARGIPYAMTTLLHYIILLVGFILAVAALGYDMTKFTILAGAFGVGLGFGMQNIVNNFVSGLILLFERPVQVGDIIQMDTVTGVVTRIGIRASIVKVGDGSEVVVPNGRLIADRFTNWTLSDRKRRLDVVVNVVKESDPAKVIELVNRVAGNHPLVAEAPAPQTCLTEFVAGGMTFELRVWTNRFEDARPLRSDLSVAVHKALAEGGVGLL